MQFNNNLKLPALAVLLACSTNASALPFSTYDPRAMAMGNAGVAVDDPATAPFFNPAMLTTNSAKKYSVEPIVFGMTVVAPVTDLQNLSTNADAMTASINSLSTNSGLLTTDASTLASNLTSVSTNISNTATATTTLTNDLTTFANNNSSLPSTITAANAATALTTLTSLKTNLTTLKTDLSTMSTNLTDTGTSLTTTSNTTSKTSTDLNTLNGSVTPLSNRLADINQALNRLNNNPVQLTAGAAMVVGVPGKNWGGAFYVNGWAAAGAALVYKDATTISNLQGVVSTASTAISTSASAIGSNTDTTSMSGKVKTAGDSVTASGTAASTASTSATDAATAIATAITTCNGLLGGTATLAACQADVATAQTKLTTASNDLNTAKTSIATANTNLTSAKDSITSTKDIMTTQGANVTSAATTATANKTVKSEIHVRAVVAKEAGFALSHQLVTHDKTWSLGFTPKLVQLQLYDATVGATSNSSSGVTGNDYLAEYSAFNFDLGVAKSYDNGWRTGVVIKNVMPQSFDFMSIATGAAAGSAKSVTGTFKMNPQARFGMSHENKWSTVALDVDMTRNDPVGLENASQFVALGGELSAWGWAQLRGGYRADLANAGQEIISLGFGLSPQIPYFKPHFDLAAMFSKNVLTDGWSNANQAGIALKMGLAF